MVTPTSLLGAGFCSQKRGLLTLAMACAFSTGRAAAQIYQFVAKLCTSINTMQNKACAGTIQGQERESVA